MAILRKQTPPVPTNGGHDLATEIPVKTSRAASEQVKGWNENAAFRHTE
jgi:hypothetical protein